MSEQNNDFYQSQQNNTNDTWQNEAEQNAQHSQNAQYAQSAQSNAQATQNAQSAQSSRSSGGNLFSFLYRTRVKVFKGETPVLNLSVLFSLLAVLSAPWLAVGGLIVALVLGYRFSVEKNAKGFAGDFQDVVRDAAGNVKAAVDSVVKDEK